jgi:DNA-binding NarL/FixJ family response regulator
MSSHIRVVLADDHAAVRAGIRELLEATPDFQIVGEAEDGRVAVELAEALRPDLVLMDIHMPRLSGIGATRKIAATWPAVRVIGLSAAAEPPYARVMREAGALALLDKTVQGSELVEIIRQLVANKRSSINLLAGQL